MCFLIGREPCRICNLAAEQLAAEIERIDSAPCARWAEVFQNAWGQLCLGGRRSALGFSCGVGFV